MYKPISHLLHSFLLLVLIGTSSSIVYYLKLAPGESPAATRRSISTSAPIVHATATSTAIPTPIPSLTPTMEATPNPDWTRLQPGLERRVIQVYDGQNGQVESLHIWRLDQKYFRMDVAFDGRPKTLESWQKETAAAMVVNGGYFSINNERYSPDGLTVIDGKASGSSFTGFGGMLAIDRSRAELQWLVEQPYRVDEPLQAALQAFPILVEPGGKLGFPAERDNHARARRTVIGQDQDGRMLFIVAPQGYFTLHQLSVYLTESDLQLDVALNLDGGGSTGILVDNPREVIPARVLLPFVILVYAR